MKIFHYRLMLATALATGLVVAASLATGPVRAEESATVPTNPGFNPGTGQINPGAAQQAPSSSQDFRKIPTPAEARAALMAPDDPNSVLGAEPPQAQNNTGGNAGDKKTTSPAAGNGGASGASDQQGAAKPETTGARSSSAAIDARPGPFGATGQTMPAKFSKRNDILDRLPIMAWPLWLTDQERQRIYQAVMADKSQPTAGADALQPASELSTAQALNGMHALPESVQAIVSVKGLQYVKGKNKVLLVRPATRTVVDEIAS